MKPRIFFLNLFWFFHLDDVLRALLVVGFEFLDWENLDFDLLLVELHLDDVLDILLMAGFEFLDWENLNFNQFLVEVHLDDVLDILLVVGFYFIFLQNRNRYILLEDSLRKLWWLQILNIDFDIPWWTSPVDDVFWVLLVIGFQLLYDKKLLINTIGSFTEKFRMIAEISIFLTFGKKERKTKKSSYRSLSYKIMT